MQLKFLKRKKKNQEESPEFVNKIQLERLNELNRMSPQPSVNSVTGIETLILFGLQVFSQIFSLFKHPINPVPVSAAPALIQQMQATPGITQDHQTVIKSAVDAAVVAHQNSL